MKKFLSPVLWLVAALVLYVAIAAASLMPAHSADLVKLQEQTLGTAGQLNENCSATLIHSAADVKTGKISTIFLTAKHCVEDAKGADHVVDLPVYQKGRIVRTVRYVATLKGTYFKADLALVELKDTETEFAKVAAIAPADVELLMGEDTWTVGYPKGLALTVTPGVFGSYEVMDHLGNGKEYIRATPLIVGGNSGGALFHLNAGGNFELLGVTTAGYTDANWIGYYTSVADIHAYLKVALPAMYAPIIPTKVGGV